MFTAQLRRWFSRPAEREAPTERPQVASAVPARRSPHSLAVVPGVEVAVEKTPDGISIRVKGEARVDCVDGLLDSLLAPAASRPPVVTLDLSELRCISSIAVGVLVAYRRGVVRAGGQVRLAKGLQPAVYKALARAELFEVFETAANANAA